MLILWSPPNQGMATRLGASRTQQVAHRPAHQPPTTLKRQRGKDSLGPSGIRPGSRAFPVTGPAGGLCHGSAELGCSCEEAPCF